MPIPTPLDASLRAIRGTRPPRVPGPCERFAAREQCEVQQARHDRPPPLDRGRERRAAERALLPPVKQADVDPIMMKRRLEGGSPHGNWNDLWFEHPDPTMNASRSGWLR